MLAGDNRKEMELWKLDRKKYDLQWPDEAVVRYLNKNFQTGEGKTIIDFGCGSGRNTVVMAKMGFEVYAVDYNEECLELTREKIDLLDSSSVQYVQNIRSDIPLPSESGDALIAWGALFYVNAKDRNDLFEEIRRVLKPDGVFLADYRSKEDAHYGKGEKIEKDLFVLNESGNLSGMNYWFCGEAELKELYAKHNLEIVNLEKKEMYVNNLSAKNSHWQVWAKRRE